MSWDAVLTDEDVLEIRTLVEEGESRASIARLYGISTAHVGHIVTRVRRQNAVDKDDALDLVELLEKQGVA